MIEILFENNDIIAVNKPEGITSNLTREVEGLPSLLATAFSGKLYLVHRLDKEASGIILLAKNPAAHRYLNDQFSQRTIQKTYLALVHGVIQDKSGVIDKPIRQFGSGRMGIDPKGGKLSITEFEVEERLKDFTLVKAHPITGRRHQIRVHFYSIGHPVVGDLRYGDRAVQKAFPRLMLHGQEISFQLPTGESMTIRAPIPESFKVVVDSLPEPKKL